MVDAKPYLKRCPFCNEDMTIMASWVGNDPDSLEELEAPVCSCGAQGPMYATREQAIAAWNTRPIEDALRAADKSAIAELVQAIEVFAGMPELQDQYAITLKTARALIAKHKPKEQADG